MTSFVFNKTFTPPTTMYSCALAKGNLGRANVIPEQTQLVHKGDRDSERNMGFIIWCGVKNVLYVTNSPLNLTKTGHPFGNGLHHA